MTWEGDLSRMSALAERIEDMARIPSRVAGIVSRQISDAIQREFDDGEDPYGDAWEPLAEATLERGREAPPLTDTALLRGSIKVAPLPGAGVGIRVGAPYAAPHQTGWSGPQGDGPKRAILPDRGELPDEWTDILSLAMQREFRSFAS